MEKLQARYVAHRNGHHDRRAASAPAEEQATNWWGLLALFGLAAWLVLAAMLWLR